MAAKLTRLTHKTDATALSDREMYHLQFSLQAASPETFGYTLVYQLLKASVACSQSCTWTAITFPGKCVSCMCRGDVCPAPYFPHLLRSAAELHR
jgi:hypothetical protein